MKDRRNVEMLVSLTNPLVRVVDGIVGERVSMRVGVYFLFHFEKGI